MARTPSTATESGGAARFLRYRRILAVSLVAIMLLGSVAPGVAGATSTATQENDRFEPNDDFSSATPVESSGNYNDLQIVSGESDFFAVELEQGQSFTATIRFSDSTGDLDLAVYGPDQSQLGSSISVSDDETVEITADQSGTYYVEAYGYAGASAPYDMELSSGEATGTTGQDRFEPNNDFSSATPVEPNSNYNNLSIDPGGESDFFAVNLEQGQSLTATIRFSHSQGDLDLAVYGPDQSQLGSSISVSDDETVEITADQSGTYYVEAYGFAGASAPYSLELSQGAVPDNDRFEPNNNFNSATAVETNNTYSDLTITPDDSDFFAVNLEQGQTLTATMRFSHSVADLDLAVYGPDQSQLGSSISVSDDETVEITAQQSGTYYVEAYYFSGDTASYDLELSQGQAPDNDQFEPNNDFSSATPVETNNTYSDLTITPEDSDFFAVNLDQGQTLTATMRFSHSVADLDLAVYGPDQSQLGSSISVSDDETVEITAQQSGTYYVEAYYFSGDTASYDLELSSGRVSVPDQDRFEPNNDFSSATPIEVNSTYSNLSIQPGGESDFFAVELEEGQQLTTTMRFSHSQGDLDLAVYSPDQTEIDSSISVSDDETVSVTAQQSGTYFIEAYGFAGASGNYELEVGTGQAADNDQFEPNDEFASATPLETNNTYNDLQIVGSEIDYYAVDLSAGESLTASIFFDHDTSDLDMGIFSPNQSLMQGGFSVTDDESVTVTASQSGTYFVGVASANQQSSPYDMELSSEQGEAPEQDRFEPNNEFASATPVEVNQTYTNLSILPGGESDFFAVELDEGEQLTTSIRFSHSQGDLDLAVYGPDQSQRGSSISVSDDETVTITADQGGTYYIEAYGFAGASGDYELEVGAGAGPSTDQFEPNDEFASAVPIDTGTYAGLSINPGGESDFYAIELEAGQTLTTTMRFSHSQGDLDLAVYGPDQSQLGSSISVSDDETVEITAQQSGTYYIEAYGFAGASAPYELEVSTGQGADNDRFEVNNEFNSATPVSPGTYSDLQIIGGESDYFAVNLEEGQTLTSTIRFSDDTGDLDMSVFGPDQGYIDGSFSVSDDETVEVVAQQSGTYFVEVYGFAGASAPYELELSTGEATGGLNLRSISYGESRSGEIDANDPSSTENRGFYEPVTFQGSAGDVVTIDMESQDDTYLILRGPDGEILTQNDDGGAGLNSRIANFELPTSGEYTIIATSYWEEATFSYSLSLETGTSGGANVLLDAPSVEVTPGGTVTLTYNVTNAGSETQAVIVESGITGIVDGIFTVQERNDDGGTWQSSEGTWLFQNLEPGASANPSITLSVASDAEFRTTTAPSRALTQNATVSDTVRVTVTETTLAQLIDTNDNSRIDDSEILTAIQLWQNEEPVPESGGRTITDREILELIGLWQDNAEI